MNTTAELAEWIIQRCTQRWKKPPEVRIPELIYEDFPTEEGLMTHSQMAEALDRVGREHPDDEFRGHRVRP
jgi:hypothetical protein